MVTVSPHTLTPLSRPSEEMEKYMSIIANPLMPPHLGGGTVASVQPFTLRENPSQMALVEGMRHWLGACLVPFINENIGKLSEDWVTTANGLIEQFEVITHGLVTEVNDAVVSIGTSVTDAQTARTAAEAARDLAEQFASQAQDIQDESVTVIVGDEESDLRNALNSIYAPLAGYVIMYDTVTTGRLSEATLASQFGAKLDASVFVADREELDTTFEGIQDVLDGKASIATQETVESGRLSPAQMSASWATKTSHDTLAGTVAGIPRNGYPVLATGKQYKSVACVLRRVNSTTWAPIADEFHSPVGVESVIMSNTYIQVNAPFTGRVITCAVTPDETFAQHGVRIGASIGVGHVRIYAYMGAAGSSPVNPGTLSASGANIWVYCVWEVD